jgi:NTE family protein
MRRIPRCLPVVLSLLVAGIPAIAHADTVSPPTATTGPAVAAASTMPSGSVPGLTRPKICLVLSGGGARGAAEVGVLKALERLRIPVDCIAGTSIGAAIGGLYAAGMTPEVLEQVLNRPDVQADMADNPLRDRLTFQEKQDQFKYLLQVEIGYEDGRFFFPQGIVNGNDPGRILNVMSLALQPDQDFDKLPIPFRAVTTDIETGDMVVLDHGDLAEAMRASMAVPGLYAPVPIDGHLLVDGGIVRNLPVDVARRMGGDVVIAVNIGTPLASREDLGDLFSVSLQVLKIFGNQNVADSVKEIASHDVLIQPDMGDITATDFDRMGEAIKLGEQQSYDVLSKIPGLQLSPEDYAGYRENTRRRPLAPLRVDFVDVEGNQSVPTELIRARFAMKPGATWDVLAINDSLRQVYDLGYFQRVDAVLEEKDGKTGLKLLVTEKPWQPNYMQLGLHIADDFEGDSIYELLGSYKRTKINGLGAEWRNEFEFGYSSFLYSELYQPLDYSGSAFIAPQAEYLDQSFDVFSGVTRIAEYSAVFPHAGLDFGEEFGNSGEGRLGFNYGHVVAAPRIGDQPNLPTYRNTLSGPRFILHFDTLDAISFPSSGYYLFANGFFPRRSLGGDISYDKLDVTAGEAFGDESGDGLLLLGELGTDFHSTLPPYEQFSLGGFLSLAGRRQGQLRGDDIFDAHAIYTHQSFNLPTGLGRGLYFGVGLDAGNVWQSGQRITGGSLQYGGSLFVGADTVLGPLYFGVGLGDDGNRTWFLFLGIPINGNTLAPSFGNN